MYRFTNFMLALFPQDGLEEVCLLRGLGTVGISVLTTGLEFSFRAGGDFFGGIRGPSVGSGGMWVIGRVGNRIGCCRCLYGWGGEWRGCSTEEGDGDRGEPVIY